MTNAILVAAALAMSPKVAFQQPHAVNIPLVTPPPITVTIGWANRNYPEPYASNVLAITPLAGGATTYYTFPVTNRAQVTGPSNSLLMAVAGIGQNGLQSAFSPSVTNQVPPPVSITNGCTVYWTTSTNFAGPYESNSLLPSVTLSNLTGQLYFRGAIQLW